ncbi:MAG TPA: Gldg family protein [Chitinivibrionales bacterium]|nr:Gldg family protein [Chitinivibrionales bacterium]
MESKKIKNSTQIVIYALVILGFLAVINYLSTKVFVRADLTEKKMYSISPASKKILKKLDDIVSVKVFFSKNLPVNVRTLESDVRDMLSEYKAYAGRNLHITYEDPTKSEEEKRKVTQMGIPELQMQTIEKDKEQVVNCFMGIAVLYGDKKEVMPVVQNLTNLEYDLTEAIQKVSRKESPKIGVLKTDTLPVIPPQYRQQMPESPEEVHEKYKPIFENLEKNYSVETVQCADGKPIDPQIKTLIVPGGSSFTNRTLFEIDQYFMNGGNLVVLADAIKISYQYGASAFPQDPGILRLMEHYGAVVEKYLVCDAACGQVSIPQKVGPFQMNVPMSYPYFVRIIPEDLNKNNPAVSTLNEMILPWISPIKVLVPIKDAMAKNAKDTGAVTASVLITSSKRSWTVGGNWDLNPQQKWTAPAQGFTQSNLAVYLTGNFTSYFAGKQIPPVKEPNVTASDSLKKIALLGDTTARNRKIVTGNKGRHLVLVGDSDFLTGQFGAQGNITFLLNVVDWLSSAEDNLISIRTRTMVDRSLAKDNLKEGSAGTAFIRWLNIILMPTLVIITGLIIFLRRREFTTAPVSTEKTEEKAK